MARPDEKKSAAMVEAYHAEPERYFAEHAIDGFLPPLAPSIMRRLRNGEGLGIELLYYQKTKAYHAALKPLSDALDRAEAFHASPEGKASLAANELEAAKQTPLPRGNNPFIAYTDESGDVYSFRKVSKLADEDDLPF
jgi:hypothetical protein